MSGELIERARSGLQAWQRGDVDALAPLLHREVELTWWEPGENAIVSARTETVPEGPAAGLQPATLIRFRDGLVTEMRQFRDRAEALAAAG